MWPILLDMTKEESVQNLRCLELEAYAGLVTAMRAQGTLSQEKLGILKEICTVLNISQERHKAEIRRVVNDEKLTTIAYHASGQKSTNDEWLQEGRRLIPLMPRIAPQTAYSAIADEVADATNKNNKQLPLPSSTERKRQSPTVSQTTSSESQNKFLFRVPDYTKAEECKKRKFTTGVENSSLAQHLMCPPKVSRVQQIYRQRSKIKQKEFQIKLKQNDNERSELIQQQKKSTLLPTSPINKTFNKATLQSSTPSPSIINEDIEMNEQINDKSKTSSENKITQHITFKQVSTTSNSTSGEIHKTIKVCTPRKSTATTKTVTTSTGQKLIVVSNPQSITTTSILQRTLTIPFVKNIAVKNIDKFKIVTSNATTPVQLAPLSSTSTFNANSKHKVVTVRTNPALKKMIPLSQLQVLNAKGGIKVLPIGGKIVTKTNGNSGSPIYIVNSSSNMQALTKSTSSTPDVVMSSMTQDSSLEPKPTVENSLDTDSADVTIEKNTYEAVEQVCSEKSNIDISEEIGTNDCEEMSDMDPVFFSNDVQEVQTLRITDSMPNESVEEKIEPSSDILNSNENLSNSLIAAEDINEDTTEPLSMS